MNILVTGGAGFVGTNLIERLIEEGHSVTSVDDYSTGHKENHIQGCKYIEMSVVDFDRYHDLEFSEFDLIYHLAGLSRIQPSFKNPSYTFNVNTGGTQKILELQERQTQK